MVRVYITKDLLVVKVIGSYPNEVYDAYRILDKFKMVAPGSVWGLDGIAEHLAAIHGRFELNKSGISKREAKKWIHTGRAKLID